MSERKRTQTKGLKSTSVVRELKAGSGLDGCRVTAEAAKAAVKASENALRHLGDSASARLRIAKAKTVDKDLLAECIRHDHQCKGLSAAAAESGRGDDRSKKDRRSIATASAVRVFATGCPLGKGSNRIRGSARDAMSAITEAYVRQLGLDSARYAKAAGRRTIKSGDISAVIAQRN